MPGYNGGVGGDNEGNGGNEAGGGRGRGSSGGGGGSGRSDADKAKSRDLAKSGPLGGFSSSGYGANTGNLGFGSKSFGRASALSGGGKGARTRSFGEVLADFFGFNTVNSYDTEALDGSYTTRTEFDITDSPALGVALGFVNPLAGLAYGVTSNALNGKPASAAAMGLGGIGKLAGSLPLGLVGDGVRALNYGLDFFDQPDLDDVLNDMMEKSAKQANKQKQLSRLGLNEETGEVTSPFSSGGRSKDLQLVKRDIQSVGKGRSSVIDSKSNAVVSRYVQTKKLGTANIRRQKYLAGENVLGISDRLGV